MVSRVVKGVAVAAVALSVAACGGEAPQPESQSESSAAAPAADEHAGHTGASRVFFVSPKDGETIKPNHRFEFGSDMYTIAAVPEGEITADQVRPGVGHFHLGIDADCVPPGQEIPRGNPTWIHFGTGNNNIEMQALTPGQHKFSVQAGDDLHRGVEGLCETITVTVAG
jgi:hypothetical protein